jgi:hypothetical protein
MATDLELKVKVDSSQLDQVQQKVGELKQFSKTIAIQYDINGKPLDVVIDKSLNLRKQVGELTKALRSVKEGSAEFQILSSALGDANDKLATSNAKSRDLLGSLQLIPGPIGQIASQLNGAISALKLFSGFSLKDIGFQFKELNNDINDIVKNLFGVGAAANKAQAEVADTVSTAANTAVESENTKATADNSAAQLKSAAAKGSDIIATKKDTIATLENTLAEKEAAIVTEQQVIAINKDIIAKENAAIASGTQTDMTVLNIAADNQSFSAKQLKILETEKEAIATKLSAEKTALDTLAKEGNTAATLTLTQAIKAFATSALGVVAILGGLAYAIYKVFEAEEKLTKAEQANLELQKKTVEVGRDNITLLENLIGLTKRSDLTQREKNKAVNDYNEKLGDTLGKVKTYAELENKLITNGPNYIKYLEIKAKAEAAYALSVEKTKEALLKGAEDPTLSATFIDRLSGIVESKDYGNTIRKQGEVNRGIQKKEIEKQSADFLNLYKGFQQEAVALAEQLKLPVPGIKTDDKTPEVKKKELQDAQLIQKEKELTAALIKEKQDREIAELLIAKDKEKREIEGLNISKKNEGVRTAALLALEKKFEIEKQAIIDKYAEEDKKKQEEIAKNRKDAANNLLETSIKSIKDEVVRSRVERLKQFQDDKDKLDQYLKDGLITREKYNEAILNMQKAFANDIEKINTDARIKELEATKAVDESRLRIFQMNMDQSNATRIGYLQQFFAQQLKVEEDNYQIELERNKNNKKELERVEQEHANNVAAIKEAERRQKFDIYKQGADDLASIFAEESDLQRAAIIFKQTLLGIELGIEISKTIAFSKLSLARSKVAVAEGTAQTAKLGFPQNVIPLALYAIQAALIISSIVKATKSADAAAGAGGGEAVPSAGKNYGNGGIIEGPSHSSAAGGTIINAEGGEAVMTKGAVTMFRPLLSLMNQAGGGTAFGGGVVGQGPYDNPDTADKSMEPQIIKTYIVERDLTSIQERQARLKSLSTL